MVNDDGILVPIFAIGTVTFGLIALGLGIAYSNANKIPVASEKTIQEGYVIPNQLEIELDDMDRVDGKETVLKYEGKPYLFKLDAQGKPIVVPYEIKPVEVPKTE